MVWTLLPHLTACIAGDGVMLLDLRRDRYFRVPPALAGETRDWLMAGNGRPPAAVLELLRRHAIAGSEDASLIQLSREDVAIPASLPEPLEREARPRLSTLGVAIGVASSWTALKVWPLSSVIDAVRNSRVSDPGLEEALSGQTLATYHRARRLVPIHKNCLLDSLALDRWLGKAGPPRRIVIGVTTEPFLAHCWLQTDTLLLNDNYDHVRRYTPILVA